MTFTDNIFSQGAGNAASITIQVALWSVECSLGLMYKSVSKVNSFYTISISNKKHWQASNGQKDQWSKGLAPPTRAVAHSHVTICRRLRMFFLHMCGVNQFCIIVVFAAVKPANNILFCIELIQKPESSLRRHKLGLTNQINSQ